jgi:hypothetical protein
VTNKEKRALSKSYNKSLFVIFDARDGAHAVAENAAEALVMAHQARGEAWQNGKLLIDSKRY